MAVRLACASVGAAVEKPQPCRVAIHSTDCVPVLLLKPVGLRRPCSGDKQHVAQLHRVFVENECVVFSHCAHLEPWVPGKKRIRFWTCLTQMLG